MAILFHNLHGHLFRCSFIDGFINHAIFTLAQHIIHVDNVILYFFPLTHAIANIINIVYYNKIDRYKKLKIK